MERALKRIEHMESLIAQLPTAELQGAKRQIGSPQALAGKRGEDAPVALEVSRQVKT